MARLLLKALKARGHDTHLASRMRSRDAVGDPKSQARLERLGKRLADQLIRAYTAPGAWRPDLWFTYHLFYKASDWIGPIVADALSIPYVVAEASHAPKRADGPWSQAHHQVEIALARADLVIGLNRRDRACVEPALGARARYFGLRPFLELKKDVERQSARAEIAARHDISPDTVWLLAVGMMREDAKLESYRVLAAALARLETRTAWRLIVVGDGPARPIVEQALGPETVFTGIIPGDGLATYYAAADVFVWPSVHEAYGMALLEAQTAGLPAVAGDSGGVPDILRDGETGILCREGDAVDVANGVARLIDDPATRQRMADAARTVTAAEHGFAGAADRIDDLLTEALARYAEGG
ncbi:MAG: glycosyltransferase family 4 protein [Proteobacteria bacterium]|nr:glycosyltransferase family 4 protein [Pseudomonadota bacterium]MDA1308279.1 glycosyltransferase family 4 protein [Pseudomonadota bacterium]